MKTKLILFGLCAATLFACTKDKTLSAAHVYQNIQFYVQNEAGENLVSPKTNGHWSEDDINVYYINKDNQKEGPYHDVLGNLLKGFLIGTTHDFFNIPGDRFVVHMSLGELLLDTTNPNEYYSTSCIVWPNGDVDKIEGKFINLLEYSYLSLIEVKINGEVMWTAKVHNLDKDGYFAMFNKVITKNGSTIKLFTDYEPIQTK